MSIKITLFEFWKLQEIRQNRSITVAQVEQATGISRATLMRLRAGNTSRADWEIIDKLCKFFGVTDGPIPFISYTNE